ncbi:MAG: TatD family hydrolase [Verrucomicrobia bacterium]|nr:TatD family hydrolase [Verrucomicrobiota bacterium]MBU1735753.1 TatD family hydrolase [Verrucomicrobiota bacterium]MBU1855806.1 TatD family hydrolase [Verrucomicrobiota bacterium]
MLTDTHVHFDGLMQAGDTLDAIVTRAAQAGVSRMIAIGGSPAANRTALEIARAYPGRIRVAVGYNRDQTVAGRQTTDDGHRTPNDGKRTMDELETMLAAPEVVAIGEIGLDFHHDRVTVAAQIELFQRMLLLARDPDSRRGRDLPVCVHTRDAEAETLAALRAHAAAWRGAPDRIGVMHCFTGGEVFARDLLALGFCISFSGIITFKNAGGLLAVAALVPEDRLLIETDAPYLAPEPFRGKPNEPAHVRRVAETLGTIRHTPWETIAGITTRNAERLFGK